MKNLKTSSSCSDALILERLIRVQDWLTVLLLLLGACIVLAMMFIFGYAVFRQLTSGTGIEILSRTNLHSPSIVSWAFALLGALGLFMVSAIVSQWMESRWEKARFKGAVYKYTPTKVHVEVAYLSTTCAAFAVFLIVCLFLF